MTVSEYLFRRISEPKPEPAISDANLVRELGHQVRVHPGDVQLWRSNGHGGFTDKLPGGSPAPIRHQDVAPKFFAERIRKQLSIGEVMLIRWVRDPTVGCYIRAVEKTDTAGERVVAWAKDHLHTPYVLGGTDCSWEWQQAVYAATHGKILLAHYSVAQWHDTRLLHVKLEDARPGDCLAVNGADPSHVAPIYSFTDPNNYEVIDEEPHALTYPVVPGGLEIRPGTAGYYCSKAFVTGVMRIPE